MITFKEFTTPKYGRLGNQLFQYAFLRTTAKRLGVKFHCPRWIGDEIFSLNDQHDRVWEYKELTKQYVEPKGHPCFNEDALNIQDNTDIKGYFQTQRYYLNRNEVLRWYEFKEEAVASVKLKYKDIDFSKSVGLHLRLGDWIPSKGQVLHRYIPRFEYYRDALELVPQKENILIFSDEIKIARSFLQSLKGNIIFIDVNQPFEDLYLMSICQAFISSPSTLSWWGAWLNQQPKKTIIVPKEGPLRASFLFKKESLKDFWPEEWNKLSALNPFWDNYYVQKVLCGCSNGISRELKE